jgi:hypothetical protein
VEQWSSGLVVEWWRIGVAAYSRAYGGTMESVMNRNINRGYMKLVPLLERNLV